jgi:hypothetical protein
VLGDVHHVAYVVTPLLVGHVAPSVTVIALYAVPVVSEVPFVSVTAFAQ